MAKEPKKDDADPLGFEKLAKALDDESDKEGEAQPESPRQPAPETDERPSDRPENEGDKPDGEG